MSRDIPQTLLQLPGFPLLQGRRLHLRAPAASDADAVFALFSAADVMRYWCAPAMARHDQAVARIDEMQAQFDTRESIHWVIASRPANQLIGTLSLHGFDARQRQLEIGYALLPGQWRQGLAAEAATLALDWACRTLAIDHIRADVDARNARSRQLLLKLGFDSQGQADLPVTRHHAQSEIFTLSAAHWRQRSRH